MWLPMKLGDSVQFVHRLHGIGMANKGISLYLTSLKPFYCVTCKLFSEPFSSPTRLRPVHVSKDGIIE